MPEAVEASQRRGRRGALLRRTAPNPLRFQYEEERTIPPASKPTKRRRFGRRKVCKFCIDKLSVVDYKDVRRLKGFVIRTRQTPPGAFPGAAPATSGSSPAPSGGPARSPSRPDVRLTEEGTFMKIILLDDVSALGRVEKSVTWPMDTPETTCCPRSWRFTPPGESEEPRGHQGRQKLGQQAQAEAEAQAQAIEALHFIQSRQASDEARLFGSVDAPTWPCSSARGLEIERRRIVSTSPSRRWVSSTCPSACTRR